MSRTLPWFLRLPRGAVARRDVIERLSHELKRDEAVRVDRGVGLQMAQAGALCAALVEAGMVTEGAAVERVTGDGRALAAWLGGR